ncbi:putative nucleotidyltransferase-like protein [Sphingomonas sp. F9_3S_D5_B_2]
MADDPTFALLLRSLTGQAEAPADWQPLLQLASDTLTIGMLASAVLGSEIGANAPEAVTGLLRDVLERTHERNRRLKAQFSQFLPVLNAAGVQPIVMRGMASLIEEQRDRGRLLSDIDLLVPQSRREDCLDGLRSLGYETFQGFHGPPFSVVLGRGEDVGMVDLHTDMQPYALGIDFDRVRPLCNPVKLKAGEALLPSPTCALLLYILHDQLHDGDYWRGLIDVRHLIETPRLVEAGVDWEQLESYFPAGPARNAMHVHLRTAKRLLGVDIPERYCGGGWARLQVRRRLWQRRSPRLMPVLAALTGLVDPPLRSPKLRRGKSSFRFKVDRALRPVNPGKI